MVDIVGNVNPTFHVLFRDDEGNPAISGTVETFKASAHSVHKATYEDRALTTALSNPIALNAAGIVSRSPTDGTPVPMYLADDENYYMVVRDSLGNIVQVIDNWNADNAFSTHPQIDEIVTTNYIPNAQFRSLVNGKTLYSSDDLNVTNNILIARDGWYLRRDVLTSTNIIEFKEFIVGQTDVPFNPKYYLNFSCSVTSTETEKDITIDIGDVETFSNQEMTFALRAKSSTLSAIEILTDQDFGSGGSSPVETIVDSFTLTSSFAQYNTTFTVADVSGKTVGTDNRFRMRIRVPLNAICNVDLANGQLNVGDTVLEFDFQPSIMNDGNASKDAIPQPADDDSFKSLTIDDDNITNVWRSFPPVGSVDWLAHETLPDGYLECDGTTYSGLPDAPYRRLALILRNRWGYGDEGFYNEHHASKYNSGIVNKFDTNVTDIVDGTTGFTFSVPEQGGDKGFLAAFYQNFSGVTITNKNDGNVTDTGVGTSGFTRTIVQQGTVSLPEISRIETTAATTLAGKYFLISSTTTDYYPWFEVDGVGIDPAVGGRTGIKIAIAGSANAGQVAQLIYYVLSGCEHYLIEFNAASTLSGGEYFLLYNSSVTFVPWYVVGGIGSEPVVAGTKVPIALAGTETDIQVAQITAAILNIIKFKVPDLRGSFIRGWDHSAGVDPDASTRTQNGTGSSAGDSVGSFQEDAVGKLPGGFDYIVDNGFSSIEGGGTLSGGAVSGAAETRPINYYLMPIIKF